MDDRFAIYGNGRFVEAANILIEADIDPAEVLEQGIRKLRRTNVLRMVSKMTEDQCQDAESYVHGLLLGEPEN